MSAWYVRYELDDQFREVWCQANSKKEAIAMADVQNAYFTDKYETDRYKRTRVVEVNPAPDPLAPTVISEAPEPKRRWFRRRRGTTD